jgi:threonine dehydrogenase-like Zn-dependent dehydrogenase
MATAQRIAITAHQQASLLPTDPLEKPTSGRALARTLVSLTSPGTELNFNFLAKEGFPRRTGYAAVVEVTEVGPDNPDVNVGDRYFCSDMHCSHVSFEPAQCHKVPDGLKPEIAVFCRLMAVSMSTMTTARARPPGRVLVTGLGPVGHLAAQIFASIGYRVEGFDLVPERREVLQEKHVAVIDQVSEGEIYDLALECSGHEEALLRAAKAVRKGGEVVMVGVPWRKNCDLSAYELLTVVFHRYIRLRSGWEWEVPRQREAFKDGSLKENYDAALRWLVEGRINVEGLYELADPEACQDVYSGLQARTRKAMTTIFDWRR